jgi:hypothetical protein
MQSKSQGAEPNSLPYLLVTYWHIWGHSKASNLSCLTANQTIDSESHLTGYFNGGVLSLGGICLLTGFHRRIGQLLFQGTEILLVYPVGQTQVLGDGSSNVSWHLCPDHPWRHTLTRQWLATHKEKDQVRRQTHNCLTWCCLNSPITPCLWPQWILSTVSEKGTPETSCPLLFFNSIYYFCAIFLRAKDRKTVINNGDHRVCCGGFGCVAQVLFSEAQLLSERRRQPSWSALL